MWLRYHEQASAPVPGSCTPAALTRSPTTSGCCSRSTGCRRASRSPSRGSCRRRRHLLRRHLPLGDPWDEPGAPDVAAATPAPAAGARPPAGARGRPHAAAAQPAGGRAGRCRPDDRLAHRRCAPRGALERYGPDFRYGLSFAPRRRGRARRGSPAAPGAGGARPGAADPERAAAGSRIPAMARTPRAASAPGSRSRFTGRDEPSRASAWSREVPGGDPGYGETSKMLAESALCLAHDELPETGRDGHTGGRDGPGPDRPAPQCRASALRADSGR